MTTLYLLCALTAGQPISCLPFPTEEACLIAWMQTSPYVDFSFCEPAQYPTPAPLDAPVPLHRSTT